MTAMGKDSTAAVSNDPMTTAIPAEGNDSMTVVAPRLQEGSLPQETMKSMAAVASDSRIVYLANYRIISQQHGQLLFQVRVGGEARYEPVIS